MANSNKNIYLNPKVAPEVSVIVPAWNVESYIKDCLTSILTQTFKNIEVIVINDCSSDKTENIVNNLSTDTRLRCIQSSTRLGPGGARNLGLNEAIGRYIIFIDGDDTIENELLETLLSATKAHNADIVECGMKALYIDDQKTTVKLVFPEVKCFEKNQLSHYLSNYLVGKNYISPSFCNKLFKAELIKKYSFLEQTLYEDMELMPKVLAAAERLVQVPMLGYNYTHRNDSVTRKFNEHNVTDSFFVYREKLFPFFLKLSSKAELPDSSELVPNLLTMYRKHLRGIWQLIMAQSDLKRAELINLFVEESLKTISLFQKAPEHLSKSLFITNSEDLFSSKRELVTEYVETIREQDREISRLNHEISKHVIEVKTVKSNPWYRFGKLSWGARLQKGLTLPSRLVKLAVPRNKKTGKNP